MRKLVRHDALQLFPGEGLDEARRDGRLQLDAVQVKEIGGRLEKGRRKFEPPDSVAAPERSPVNADKFDTIVIDSGAEGSLTFKAAEKVTA